ncbi:MAG: hypothetical protein GKR88_09080 [Flavobacteriaceae bacterium]|nr:MAG: hypothetical protein GKR88_09080 [Flavobacteriaceae bacterium]
MKERVGLYYEEDIIVAWFLSEIISSSTNEKITFEYTSHTINYPILGNNSLEIDPASNSAVKVQEYIIYPDISTKRVRRINLISNDVKISEVVFDSNKSRNDISGNALSKISVFQGNTLLKYFNVNIENVNNERIFLESIQEFSGDGLSSKPPYEFEYINENLLPGRMEYLADHWGYYSANGTEFPYLAQFPWRSAKSKEPSDYAMYGSLKKIVFPTGGLIRLNMN